jgi:hypothetical protein
VRGVEVEGRRIDIHEDGLPAVAGDARRRREERERGRDHLVARREIESVQRQHEGVGARSAADRVSGAHVGGDLLLERGDFAAEDEHLGVHHAAEHAVDLVLDRLELRLQIQQRNGCHGELLGGRVVAHEAGL